MKTKILLTLGAVLLTAATYNLYAGNGAAFLTALNTIKAAPVTEVITVTYKTPANAALLTPRAAGNMSMIAVANGANAGLKVAKCQLIGTPRSIESAGNKARMVCCNMTRADCSTTAMCSK